MGYELRKVPPNWVHPINEKTKKYQPMHEFDYEKTLDEWVKEYVLWKDGKHSEQEKMGTRVRDFIKWIGEPPDIDLYVPYKKEECTWYQLYENMTEGTPLTPSFSDAKGVINYLVNHGCFWSQETGVKIWGTYSATKLILEEFKWLKKQTKRDFDY